MEFIGRWGIVKLSAQLQKILVEKGITQKELAVRAEITESALSHYIKGDRFPRSNTVAKLAVALSVSVDELLGTMPDEQAQGAYNTAHTLIARHGKNMSKDQKLELVKLLME